MEGAQQRHRVLGRVAALVLVAAEHAHLHRPAVRVPVRKVLCGLSEKVYSKFIIDIGLGRLTYLLEHDLNAVLVRGALLAELPAAEVVKVTDGDHARLGVPHQADVAGQGGVRTLITNWDRVSIFNLQALSLPTYWFNKILT